jgi:hypothetical protein
MDEQLGFDRRYVEKVLPFNEEPLDGYVARAAWPDGRCEHLARLGDVSAVLLRPVEERNEVLDVRWV